MALFNGYHKGKHEEHLNHIDAKLDEISGHVCNMDTRVQRLEKIYWALGCFMVILVSAAPMLPNTMTKLFG